MSADDENSDGARSKGSGAIADGLDRSLLERIFKSEAPRLARYFRGKTRDHEEARDLVQEAFARLAAARPSALLGNPDAYLQRIARNLLFDRSKRKENRLAARHVRFVDDMAGACPPDQAWTIEADDVLKRYRSALAELTPRTREVFLLHRVEELSYKDIAARLAISVATVEYHMTRALVHLDRALERE